MLNFEEGNIRADEDAVCCMNQKDEERLFFYLESPDNKMVYEKNLCNILSWNLQLQHFLVDKTHFGCRIIICFTESHAVNQHFNVRKLFTNQQHGLVICYNSSEVEMVLEFTANDALELPPVLFKSQDEIVLLVLVYRSLLSIGLLVQDLIYMISSLPINKYRNYRIFIVLLGSSVWTKCWKEVLKALKC